MDRSEPFDVLRVPGPETSEQKIARLELENAWLRDRIAALERRLGLNSSNSGKPPSSDGLQKPSSERRTRSLRGRTGRKPGGQEGHKGMTLCRTASPDFVEDRNPSVCGGCGASLSGAAFAGTPVVAGATVRLRDRSGNPVAGGFHSLRDDRADPFSSRDKVPVGKVGVARRGAVAAMAEQLADQGQMLARHDGLAGRRVAQVVEAQPTEPGIGADRAPARCEAVGAPAFGVAREQERIGVARTGQRLDERPCRLAERHGARAGLRIGEIDGVGPDVAPAQIEHLAAAASGAVEVEREGARARPRETPRRDAVGERAPHA